MHLSIYICFQGWDARRSSHHLRFPEWTPEAREEQTLLCDDLLNVLQVWHVPAAFRLIPCQNLKNPGGVWLLYSNFSCLCMSSWVICCCNSPDHQPPSLNAEFCVVSIFRRQKKKLLKLWENLDFPFPVPPAKAFIFQGKSDPRRCLGYSSRWARRCPHAGKLRSTWTFSVVFQRLETSVLSYFLNPVLLCPLHHPKGWNVQDVWPLSSAMMTQHIRNHSEQIHGVKLQLITLVSAWVCNLSSALWAGSISRLPFTSAPLPLPFFRL